MNSCSVPSLPGTHSTRYTTEYLNPSPLHSIHHSFMLPLSNQEPLAVPPCSNAVRQRRHRRHKHGTAQRGPFHDLGEVWFILSLPLPRSLFSSLSTLTSCLTLLLIVGEIRTAAALPLLLLQRLAGVVWSSSSSLLFFSRVRIFGCVACSRGYAGWSV